MSRDVKGITNKLTTNEMPKPEKNVSSKRLTEMIDSVSVSSLDRERECRTYLGLQPDPLLQIVFHMLRSR